MWLKTSLGACLVAVWVLLWGGYLEGFEDPDAVIEHNSARDWPDNSRMRAARIE